MQAGCRLLASMPLDHELNDLMAFPHGLTSLNLVGATPLFSCPQALFNVWPVSPGPALNTGYKWPGAYCYGI